MAESELFYVRIATLLRNKYASILRVVHKTLHVRTVKDFCPIVLDIYPALTTALEIKHKTLLAITLVRTS